MAVRPTARGLGVAVVIVTMVALATLTGSQGPVASAGALGVLLLSAPALAWSRARRAVGGVNVLAHVVPPMVPTGGSSSLELTVLNAARRPMPPVGLEVPETAWGPVQPATAAGALTTMANGRAPAPAPVTGTVRGPGHLAPGTVALVRLPGLDPGGAATMASRVPTARRGMYALAPRRVWVHDPLGLCGVAVAATPGAVVVVHPRPAPDVTLPGGTGVGTHAGAPLSSVPPLPTDTGVGGELADLRPYVPGDRLHLLHWPAFARYGALLVRRFDPEEGGSLRIVVDDRPGVHRRDAFEQALSATLAIVEDAAGVGIAVELETLSGSHATVVPTPQGVATALVLLATLQPGRAGPSGPGRAGVEARSGSPTIVTTVTGESALPPALRRFAKVVV